MTVKQSPENQLQTNLLAEFIAAINEAKRSIVKTAHAYKACVDAGIDMSRYGKGLGFRLIKIAEGKLLPEAHDKLLGNDAMVEALATLPTATQKQLLDEGVSVWRGKPEVVSVEDVRPSEARRLVDPVTRRLLSPQEQGARQTVVPVARHDMPITINLSREDYNELASQAKRARLSPGAYILAELVKSGVLSKGKKAA